MTAADPRDHDKLLRHCYEAGDVYATSTICRKSEQAATDYVDELLSDKLVTLRRHLRPGLVVDLCCATGNHLIGLSKEIRLGVGIDFSIPFITRANSQANEKGLPNLAFLVGDASQIPLPELCVSTLYCFSAIYQMSRVERVVSEVSRVLEPGGRAILDLANSQSLNAICCRAYPELPELKAVPVSAMLKMFQQYGLRVVEHRTYQLLPLWANKPHWLWPLLHPGWKTVMKYRLRGRMLDEWISGLPIIRKFAFRHLLVGEKT